MWRSGEQSAGLGVKLAWNLADKLVYSKIRMGTGGNLRLVFSGGAPLAKEFAEFFWAVGVPIYQGYGLTETAPVLTSNYPQNRMGSAGKPIPNVELRIAQDGEILAKGPCVMQGYYKSVEATREVLSADGWFSTGDIGYLDKDNYLFITDRKKDLIKTAAGKFVAPQPIENALKTSPFILNAMVVGESRHSLRKSRRAGNQVFFQQGNGCAARGASTHRSRSETPDRQPRPIRIHQALRPPAG
jgi:long-chain acyl-CoA synthetase